MTSEGTNLHTASSEGSNLHTASSVSLNIHSNIDQGSSGQDPAQTILPNDSIQRPTKRLRFACVNTRSVRNKIAVIVEHMVNGFIDICTVTETWLKECDSVSMAGLSTDGFIFKSFPRQSGRNGGGTGIMYRESLDVKLTDCKENRSFEFTDGMFKFTTGRLKL